MQGWLCSWQLQSWGANLWEEKSFPQEILLWPPPLEDRGHLNPCSRKISHCAQETGSLPRKWQLQIGLKDKVHCVGFNSSPPPPEETPSGECKGKGNASDFSEAKAGGNSFRSVVYLLLPEFLFGPGKLRRGSLDVIYLFLRRTCDSPECCVSCEIVYRPAHTAAEPPPRRHFTSPNPGLRERAKGGEVTFGRWDEPASSWSL